MTTKAAAKKAPEKTAEETVTDLFKAAMKSYEDALKSGIAMQEESVKLWKELLSKLGAPEDLQKKLDEMSTGVIPSAHDRMEEFLTEFKKSSKMSTELMQKALAIPSSHSIPEAQGKVQDLVETSLSSLRTSMQTALNTNARIMNNWQDLVDKAIAVR